jgi:hypothetical protein
MLRRLPLLSLPTALAIVLALAGSTAGQMYEDRAEPSELGIREIGELTIPSSSYVGAEACQPCHERAYYVWLGTEHARSFVPMLSEAAMEIAKEMGAKADSPAKSGVCLGCHATAVDVPAAYREPGFHMGDGVACEKCHGPGADHIAAMEDGRSDDAAIVMPAVPDVCLRCHLDKPAHEKVARIPKFVFEERWPRIAHPEGASK